MTRNHRPARWAWALLLIGLTGCGSTLPPESDASQARTLLTEALDGWKQGAKPNAKPSVRVSDREWAEGSTLLAYHLEGDGQRLGQNVQQTVALEMKTLKGKTLKKTVNYVITTGSTPLIARQDIDE